MSFIHCVLSFAADKIRRVRSENIRLRYIGVRSSRIFAILFALWAVAMASGAREVPQTAPAPTP